MNVEFINSPGDIMYAVLVLTIVGLALFAGLVCFIVHYFAAMSDRSSEWAKRLGQPDRG